MPYVALRHSSGAIQLSTVVIVGRPGHSNEPDQELLEKHTQVAEQTS